MSIAFSSSLLGLAGSLILGFIDISLGQAQNKFSLFFEKTINNNSIPDLINTSSSDNLSQQALQKIYAGTITELSKFRGYSGSCCKIFVQEGQN